MNTYCILHEFTRKLGYKDYLIPCNSHTKHCPAHCIASICTGLHSKAKELNVLLHNGDFP